MSSFAREDPDFWDEADPFDDAQRRRDIITYGNVTLADHAATVLEETRTNEQRAEITYEPEYEEEDG